MIYKVMNMKEKLKTVPEIIAIIIFALFCLTESHAVKEGIYNALTRCIETIIPSLYAMMIISSVMTKSNFISKISKYAGIYPVFIFSVFAGYPVGTKILCEQYRKGSITKKYAEIMSGICYGAGNAFINGCIAGKLYGGKMGNIILFSTVGADIILLLVTVPFFKKYKNNDDKKLNISFELLNESIAESGKSMGIICLSVIFFSVLVKFMEYTGFTVWAGDIISHITGRDRNICMNIIYTFMDITNAENLPKYDYTLLPFLSFVTALGGICVLFQIKAVTRSDLSMIPIILMRISASVLSAVICRLIMPYMISGEAVYVSVNMSMHKAQSPVPSIMLILMTFLIFGENKKLYKTNKNNSGFLDF